jgi:hypothetical protein
VSLLIEDSSIDTTDAGFGTITVATNMTGRFSTTECESQELDRSMNSVHLTEFPRVESQELIKPSSCVKINLSFHDGYKYGAPELA